MMQKAFTLIELLVVIAIIAILLGLLGVGFVEVPIQLVIGWIVFLIRSIQEMSVDWDGIVIGFVCTALLVVGVHSFGAWLTRHRAANLPVDAPKPEWKWGVTYALVGVVALMFVAGISAIGITHQSYWLMTSPERWFESSGLRQASARVQSMYNLKQVSIGAHAEHDMSKTLPPSLLLDASGRALHGWPTLLLPYVEQDTLFKQIDLKKPWHQQESLFKTEVSVYLNPLLDGKDEAGNPLIHYAGNIHVLAPGKRLTLKDIKDGAATTILFGEIAAHVRPWGTPWHLRDPARGLGNASTQFNGPPGRNPEGMCISFADGSVRFLSKNTDPEVLRALATPAGGEKLAEDWER